MNDLRNFKTKALIYFDIYFFSDFKLKIPLKNNVMLRLFYITFFCFLFIACNQTGTEKNYIKNLEEKNQILEKELQDLKNNKNSNNIELLIFCQI